MRGFVLSTRPARRAQAYRAGPTWYKVAMATIRAAWDEDSAGIIALIGAVFAEYPGCVLDVDAEEPELRRPAAAFDRFWVLEGDAGEVAGCVACALRRPVAELKKLYLARGVRGRGWGRRLVELVEDEARAHGARRLEMWSDTRFTTAHAVYERLGYARSPGTRALHDLSGTIEYHFEKTLRKAL